MPTMADFFSSFSGGGGGGPKTPPKLSKKKMWVVAAGILLGVCLILAGGKGGGSGNNTVKNPAEQEKSPGFTGSRMAFEEEFLAARLKDMLQKIEGAGKVDVTLRLAVSSSSDYVINRNTGRKTTLEKDQGGGTRTINEDSDSSQLAITRDNGGESPVLEKENSPVIAGVLVVAEGAGDPGVRAGLFDAVQVALGIEPQKILVLPAQGGAR